MEYLKTYPELCLIPIITSRNDIIQDTQETDLIKAPTSLIELQKFEDRFITEGWSCNFFYEDQTGEVSVRKEITSYNDYKNALNHITGQGLVIIVEKFGDKTFSVRDWVCKICMCKNSPDLNSCKICKIDRPPTQVMRKIQD